MALDSHMNLYLSSEELGEYPNHWLDMLPDRAKVGIIANAVDYKTEDAREGFVNRQHDRLSALGVTPEEIELTSYYDKPDYAIRNRIKDFDGVWVTGGNVFMLRASMELSGLDRHIGGLVMESGLVYAGFSAGGCQTARHLYGLELVDPLHQLTERQRTADVFKGLGLLDKLVVPHYKSPNNPCTGGIDKVVTRLDELRARYVTLSDGDALVIRGGEEKILRARAA
jgi:dipeptidase E